MQQDIGGRLRILMEVGGLGQEEVARAARVSQPTVCRALQRGYSRRSKSRQRLEKYINITELKLHKKTKLPTEVSSAINQVWDKTETHAQLIAKVIRALEGFVPRTILEEHARKSRND
jgi:transcriptional regulator with XRE-family HTH domain